MRWFFTHNVHVVYNFFYVLFKSGLCWMTMNFFYYYFTLGSYIFLILSWVSCVSSRCVLPLIYYYMTISKKKKKNHYFICTNKHVRQHINRSRVRPKITGPPIILLSKFTLLDFYTIITIDEHVRAKMIYRRRKKILSDWIHTIIPIRFAPFKSRDKLDLFRIVNTRWVLSRGGKKYNIDFD